MPLVTSEKIIENAMQGGYAVCALNIENMEMAQGIIEAAEELKTPVIIQTTPSTVRYGSLKLYSAIVEAIAKNASVSVAMHLDHGDSFELASDAVLAGYTSVMIDGSQKSFEGNIAVTKQVVEFASRYNVPVEAELGKVGGKEDDLEVEDCGYTDPEEAAVFVKETGITTLAVAIGTAHGIYSGTPVLDIGRLKELRKKISIPLVLHGASGIGEDVLRECISSGISKINFATELRIAYSNGVKKALKENPDAYDPKFYGKSGKNEVYELVKKLIKICNNNKI